MRLARRVAEEFAMRVSDDRILRKMDEAHRLAFAIIHRDESDGQWRKDARERAFQVGMRALAAHRVAMSAKTPHSHMEAAFSLAAEAIREEAPHVEPWNHKEYLKDAATLDKGAAHH